MIRRSLSGKLMHYRINGGREVRTASVREWEAANATARKATATSPSTAAR